MLVLFITISVVFVLIRLFFEWKYTYWKSKNLPYLQPHFPFGNFTNPFKLNKKPGYLLSELYKEMKKNGWKHGGLYGLTLPVYVVVDLEYVKNVLTKDFEYFEDRGVYYNEKDDPLSGHLLYVTGSKWRSLKKKLNPCFTSSKIKEMFHIIERNAKNLLLQLENKCLQGETVDTYDVASRFTMDNVGSCILGIECDLLNGQKSAIISNIEKCIHMSKFRLAMIRISSFFPNFARKLRIRHYPKDATDFFFKVVTDIVDHRKFQNHPCEDFVQLLMDSKNAIGREDLSMEEIAAQCLIFFIAGFETSASAISFALYELAKHQDIQNKVREEINAVTINNGNKISYDLLMSLKYLDQVIYETMRMYPAALYLTRRCCKNYKIQNENVVIDEGTTVIIPVHGIHYDEEIYPNPKTFDPDRFNETNKHTRHSYSYLPFGEGPRICIARRFGLFQTKIGLYTILKNFRITLNKNTKEPLVMATSSAVLRPETKIWLDLQKI